MDEPFKNGIQVHRRSVKKNSIRIEQSEKLGNRDCKSSRGTFQNGSLFMIYTNRTIDFLDMGIQSFLVDRGRTGKQGFFDGPQRTINLKTVS